MNIFNQYGIKEVADVTLYSIELDENDDEVYVPVLYLDTLKISDIQQTAEQTSARGGLGNAELIVWDYGKEITITLEDALYSPASQGMIWAGKLGTKHIKLNGILTDKRDGFPTNATLRISTNKDFSQEDSNYIWKGVSCEIIGDNAKRCRMEDFDIYYNKDDEVWSLVSKTNTNIIENSIYSFSLGERINVPPEEMIYEINHGLQNVYYLDRMEKCKATQTFAIDAEANLKHSNYRYLPQYKQTELTVFIDPKTECAYEPNADEFIRKNGEIIEGNLRIIKQHEIYYKWTRTKAFDNTSLGHQIIVDAMHFPGTYKLVGETYSRSRNTGKDQRYQFEIPLCKMGAENNLTLEAAGDPTTFSMTLKVLRKEDGQMMKLTQYSISENKYDGYISGSTGVVSKDLIEIEE